MATKRKIKTLQADYDKLSEFVDMLRVMPEPKAVEVIRMLRLTTTDPVNFLSSEKGSAFCDAMPRLILARLPSQGSVEFELMIRHAVAYPTLAPLDATAVGFTPLLTAGFANSVASEIRYSSP
jgi:hypothetical protein